MLDYTRLSITPQNYDTEVPKIIDKITKAKHLCLDLETTSLDPKVAKIVAVILVCEKSSWYFKIRNRNTLLLSNFLKDFKAILEEKEILKIGHNLKYECAIFKENKITLKGIYHDTMLAEYVIDSNRTHYNLENLVLSYFDVVKTSYKEIIEKDKEIYDIPKPILEKYTYEDGEYTHALWRRQSKLLKKKDLAILETIEYLLVPVLATMESNGVLINSKKLQELSLKFLKKKLN